MSRLNLIIYLISVFFFSLPLMGLKSQITIGANIPPEKGALLDLKEFNSATPGGANSFRGLGMPRVKLKDKKDLTALGVSEDADKELHTGLIVYNISENDVCFTFPSGLYVWNGREWDSLGGDIPSVMVNKTSWVDNGDGTGILTDFEGNEYNTKDFNGTIWMVDNLRSTIASDGSNIGGTNGVYINLGYRVQSANAKGKAIICTTALDDTPVPIKIGGVDPSLTYDTYASRFGLLYTQAQSVAACPAGWSLSTEDNWDALRLYLGGTGVGKKIKSNDLSYTPVEGSGFYWQGYASGNANNVGFNAVPSGYVNQSNEALNFSYGAYFWTPTDNKYYYLYYVSTDVQTVITANNQYSLSVRCVKD